MAQGLAAGQPLGPFTQMARVATAMTVAALLALPVAWLYILTRRKKGFRQSVVHTQIVLPVVVSGVVTCRNGGGRWSDHRRDRRRGGRASLGKLVRIQ